MIDVNGILYFVAYKFPDNINGIELWRLDNPTSLPQLVKDIYKGIDDSTPQKLIKVNNQLFFMARSQETGYQLWRSDGTDVGTSEVRQLMPTGNQYADFIGEMKDVNGILYFVFVGSSLYDYGRELWRSDGSGDGTYLVRDIVPGSIGCGPLELTNVNGIVYFTADTPEAGRELWRSDGTTNGTYLVKDIRPGSGSYTITNLNSIKQRFYFTGGADRQIWQSDGTEVGTRPAYSSYSNRYYSTYIAASLSNNLLLGGNDLDLGSELWTLQIDLCQSLQSGNWVNLDTWTCGRVPTISDEVIINAGHTVTISTNTAEAKQVKYYSDGKIQFDSGAIKISGKGTESP